MPSPADLIELFTHIKNNNEKEVRALYSQDPHIILFLNNEEEGETVAHVAALNGSLDVLQFLIEERV